ncbi:pirin family protein [uncultured Imperialibacter sp.]|uniref:pirin family protein n=1 Tax=uncultured Imperialibacter sp. TaxID=1672639 RepID=UPI0030DCBB78|tara:strand:- start:2501 stop:3397 length:897 start_codon:yes stop_codon:yes gene_type:complete
MSNIDLIIEERPADIGHFLVGRLLPFRGRRMVGPFIFIDHMGPAVMGQDDNLDIGPHPHIGLSTLTYLFEGHVMHRDTLGSHMEINPGEVNWMTSGKGIVHSERTPEYLRHAGKTLHGLQIWVALPKHLEQMEPEFFHVSKDDIPTWEKDGASFKLIAGEAFGRKSPVPVYSPLFLLEIKTETKRTIDISKDLFGEVGLYILEGRVENEGNVHEPKRILVAKDSSLCHFEMYENTTVYVFGGEAFAETRHIYWNFVSSDPELIEQAKRGWHEQKFPLIEGETDIVPLPPQAFGLRPKM